MSERTDAAVNAPSLHTIRSFTRRHSRITAAQQRKLDADTPWLLPPLRGPIALEACYARRAPVWMEIGFGSGETLMQLASTRPELNLLGVEVHRPGIGHLLLGLDAQAITNVRVVEGNAVEVLSDGIVDGALERVLLLFPDPWPKRRHHKRRLLQPEFVRLIGDKLAAGGQLHFATDWLDYARQALQVLEREPAFENSSAGGQFAAAPAYRVETRFERRGRRLGHEIYDLLFTRV